MSDNVRFLDVDFDNLPFGTAVTSLLDALFERKGGRAFYANAHTLVTAEDNPELKAALEKKDFLLADGSGVRWGSSVLGTPIQHNLNGTDMVPALCKAGGPRRLSIYLLGANPGVAKEAATNLAASYPGLKIAGTRNGYFANDQIDEVLGEIREANPHLLLVAMGVPRQEIWIDRHADKLPGILCMGVGGLFDFLALRVPRAPALFRKTGFEWVWRLMMEPKRLWRRYVLGNAVFMGMVARRYYSA